MLFFIYGYYCIASDDAGSIKTQERNSPKPTPNMHPTIPPSSEGINTSDRGVFLRRVRSEERGEAVSEAVSEERKR